MAPVTSNNEFLISPDPQRWERHHSPRLNNRPLTPKPLKDKLRHLTDVLATQGGYTEVVIILIKLVNRLNEIEFSEENFERNNIVKLISLRLVIEYIGVILEILPKSNETINLIIRHLRLILERELLDYAEIVDQLIKLVLSREN